MALYDLFSNQIIDDSACVDSENFSSKDKVKTVDLFSGVGGFHFGIAASASKINKGVKPILVSDIEASCQLTYNKNFNVDVCGDIYEIPLSEYTKSHVDIVTAGFPCQPFSNSGKKLGLADDRGQFYYRIEEIIKYFNSKSFILENVPGILTNGGGSYQAQLSFYPRRIGMTMKFLEENLLKLKDYCIKWIELDSSLFGSPQVRKRVYVIGIHRDFTNSLELAFKSYLPKSFITIAEDRIIPELEMTKSQLSNLISFMKVPPSYMNGMRRVGNAYLCKGGNIGQGYHSYGKVPTLTKVWARFLPIYFPHESENLPNLNERIFIPNKFYGKGYFRKASVRETARLQGFPDHYMPHDNKNIAYQHSGNAVNSKVVREISDNIFRYIF